MANPLSESLSHRKVNQLNNIKPSHDNHAGDKTLFDDLEEGELRGLLTNAKRIYAQDRSGGRPPKAVEPELPALLPTQVVHSPQPSSVCNGQQLVSLSIAALCALLNHFSYLIFLVVYLALSSSLPSTQSIPAVNNGGNAMIFALMGILHILVSGSIVTILLPMSENKHLSRNERLGRQCGHTLMLSHFGGFGSIGEIVRVYYGVAGCGIPEVVRSVLWQFGTISILKPFLLIPIYRHLAHILTQINQITAGQPAASSSSSSSFQGSGTADSGFFEWIGITERFGPYDLTYYLGYSCFIIMCLNFIFPVIAYVCIVEIDDLGKDEFEQVAS